MLEGHFSTEVKQNKTKQNKTKQNKNKINQKKKKVILWKFWGSILAYVLLLIGYFKVRTVFVMSL